jgi:hypothetical protein
MPILSSGFRVLHKPVSAFSPKDSQGKDLQVTPQLRYTADSDSH